jgi:NADH-quinone oxidoreductase subunit L
MDLEDPKGIQGVLYNKYYVDEIYDFLFVKPTVMASKFYHTYIDKGFIDGMVEATGFIASTCGRLVRLTQTGNIGFYLFAMVISVIIIIVVGGIIPYKF